MKHLVDWGETMEKPKFKGFESYQEKKPNGIFRLSDGIVRKCVVVSFYYLDENELPYLLIICHCMLVYLAQ